MKKRVRKTSKAAVGTPGMSKRFDILDKKLDRIIDSMVTRKEFEELTGRVSHIETILEDVVTAIDRLTKAVEDLTLEYKVIKVQIERHDRWFKEIAEKIGIELKP